MRCRTFLIKVSALFSLGCILSPISASKSNLRRSSSRESLAASIPTEKQNNEEQNSVITQENYFKEFDTAFEEDDALWERYLVGSTNPAEECALNVEISCSLSDGTDCQGVLLDTNQCSAVPINVTFSICNIAVGSTARIKELNPLIDSRVPINATDIDTIIPGGKCSFHTETTEVDICNGKFFWASMYVFADTVESQDKSCNGWNYGKWTPSTIQPTNSPTSPPSETPSTIQPTYSPTSSPSESCSVSAHVECYIDGENCDDFLINPNQCSNTNIEYKFKICNLDQDDPVDIKGSRAKIGTEVVTVVPLGFDFSNDLNATSCITHPEKLNIDICDGVIPWTNFWVRASSSTGMQCNPGISRKFKTKTMAPTKTPTTSPTEFPSSSPTNSPTLSPTLKPTLFPTKLPSNSPTLSPTLDPTLLPTKIPSNSPTYTPTLSPTMDPTLLPTTIPTYSPTNYPTASPTETCEIGLVVSCFGESIGNVGSEVYDVPCQELEPDPDNCEKTLKYQFVFANLADVKETVYGLEISGNILEEYTELDIELFRKQRDNVFKYIDIDFCDVGGNELELVARALARTDKTGTECGSEDGYKFEAPTPPCQLDMTEVVTCSIDDSSGTKTSCQTYLNEKPQGDECNVDIVFEYEIENVGLVCEQITDVSSTINGETSTNLPLDGFTWSERRLCPGEKIILSQKISTDICSYSDGKEFIFDIKINDRGDGCHGYGYFSIDEPNAEPTPSPTIPHTCDVNLAILCFGDLPGEAGYNTPCEQLTPDPDQCNKMVKYRYVVKNNADVEETIFGLQTSIHGSGIFDLSTLEVVNLQPDEVHFVEQYSPKDFCKNGGKKMRTNAYVQAKTVVSGSTCDATKRYAFTPPSPPCQLEMDQMVGCSIDDDVGMSCQDYANTVSLGNQCNVDVIFEYDIENVGISCQLVSQVSSSINGDTPVDLDLDDFSWSDRKLCPSEALTLTQKTSIDICKFVGNEITFDLDINGGDDGCNGFGIYNIDFPQAEPTASPTHKNECNLEMDLTCRTPSNEECVLSTSKSECSFRPHYFETLFSGGKCTSSDNSQDMGKFICEDIGEINSMTKARIVARSAKTGTEYFDGTVSKGEMFRIGRDFKVDADTLVTVSNIDTGATIQRFVFHTSCSQNLFTNDVFGGITIIGFGDDSQYVKGSPDSFIFTYEITNVGNIGVALQKVDFTVGDKVEILPLGGRIIGGNGNAFQSEYHVSSVRDAMLSGSLLARAEAFGTSTGGTCNASESMTIDSEVTKVICEKRPTEMVFEIDYRTCSESQNSQSDSYRSKKKPAFTCNDNSPIPSHPWVVITSSDVKQEYFRGYVELGDKIQIASDKRMSSETTVGIFYDVDETDTAQSFTFHSSCSQNLFLGDTFGALKLVGFTNHKQGEISL